MNEALAPWFALPDISMPIGLDDGARDLSELFDLPEGSACTWAKIEPDGRVVAARWRGTGSRGWYPASTIKWVAAALALHRMDELGLPLDATLEIDADESLPMPAEPAQTFKDLILGSLVMSDNDFYSILNEFAGFAWTRERMQAWGAGHSIIRSHFRRPRFNHSRPMTVRFAPDPNGAVREPMRLETRPAVDLPLNTSPDPSRQQSNWFTCDDAVRCVLATLSRPTRETTHFDSLVQGLQYTNQRYLAQGAARAMQRQSARPGWVALSKPGWWPGEGDNSEWAYMYDLHGRSHYAVGIYVQGSHLQARQAMTQAAEAVCYAIQAEGWSPG